MPVRRMPPAISADYVGRGVASAAPARTTNPILAAKSDLSSVVVAAIFLMALPTSISRHSPDELFERYDVSILPGPGKPWVPTQFFRRSRRTQHLKRRLIHPFGPFPRHSDTPFLRCGDAASDRPSPTQEPQNFLEQFLRRRDLGHLEDGIAGAANDLGANLHEFSRRLVSDHSGNASVHIKLARL
jgi:hypothetical protein